MRYVYNEVLLLQILSKAYCVIYSGTFQIYEHFTFPGTQHTALSTLSENVPILSCGGLTKRFLVPGWRMGWIIVHDRNNVFAEVRKGLAKLATRSLGPNTIIQASLPAILEKTPLSFFKLTTNFIHVSYILFLKISLESIYILNIFPEKRRIGIRSPEGRAWHQTHHAQWGHVHDGGN